MIKDMVYYLGNFGSDFCNRLLGQNFVTNLPPGRRFQKVCMDMCIRMHNGTTPREVLKND